MGTTIAHSASPSIRECPYTRPDPVAGPEGRNPPLRQCRWPCDLGRLIAASSLRPRPKQGPEPPVTIDTGTSGFPGPPADRSPIPAGTSGGRTGPRRSGSGGRRPRGRHRPTGDRRSRPDRQLPHGRPGQPRRRARLALPAALLRRGGVLRPARPAARTVLFSISPIDRFRTRRRYRDDTAVLETTFETARGTAVLTDAMPVRDDPESTLLPETEIVRRLSVVSGEMDVSVRFAPRPSYGRRLPRLWPCGTLGWSVDHRRAEPVLSGRRRRSPVTATGDALEARLRLAAGETRAVLACLGDQRGGGHPAARRSARRADRRGRGVVAAAGPDRCRFEGRHAPLVRRSAVTLKMLAYAPLRSR